MKEAVFKKYAYSYDTLYATKDYNQEISFVEDILKKFHTHDSPQKILDLGCGTGGHAIPLANLGYSVLGIDRSDDMIECARAKLDDSLKERVKFEIGDLQNFTTDEQFDCAICMFAVLGYQTTNAALMASLSNVKRALRPGGIFIADFWYGPAVLSDLPVQRVKTIVRQDERLIRIATPTIQANDNVVEVDYQLLRLKDDRILEETSELHAMRYFFQPEMELFLDSSGFRAVHFCEFGLIDNGCSKDTWNITVIARA